MVSDDPYLNAHEDLRVAPYSDTYVLGPTRLLRVEMVEVVEVVE